ncbi:MAG: ferritin family protein [Thermodesulfobacteriota bacterium]
MTFYEGVIVKDEKGKEVLEQLAKDELNHIRALTALSVSLEEEGKWVTYEEAVSLGVSTKKQKAPIFPDKDLIPRVLGNAPSDIDVLNFGIDIEEKAVDYYTKALEIAKDQDEKSFLSSMINIENGHLELLRWEYDYIIKSGFWCDFQEYTVEGEK